MKFNKLLTSASLLSAMVFAFQGCTHTHPHTGEEGVVSAPAKSTEGSVVSTGGTSKAVSYGEYNGNGFEESLFTFEKSVLTEHTVGEEIVYEYSLTAKENIKSVKIDDVVPAGMQYVSSSPEATVSGNNLVWNLGELDAGATESVTLTLKALRRRYFHKLCFCFSGTTSMYLRCNWPS